MGITHFAVGKVSFLSVEQVLIEYVIAFAVMGLAGLLYSPFQKALKAEKYTSAITLACTAAFCRSRRSLLLPLYCRGYFLG